MVKTHIVAYGTILRMFILTSFLNVNLGSMPWCINCHMVIFQLACIITDRDVQVFKLVVLMKDKINNTINNILN